MIEAIIERCAGIDVGKKFVLVCVMTGGAKDEPHTQIKKFGTIVSVTRWLLTDREWLRSSASSVLRVDSRSEIAAESNLELFVGHRHRSITFRSLPSARDCSDAAAPRGHSRICAT